MKTARGLDKRAGRRYAPGMTDIQAARDFFPRGLIQPAGSFRFSLDALLLAAFAAKLAEKYPPAQPPLLLDLGCGCGVAAFGLMLQRPEFTAIGLDKQASLLEAARANAARLGFGGRFSAREMDLEGPDAPAELERLLAARQADLVIANPPYRQPGSGRLPASESRRQALFGGAGNLTAFVRAAAQAAGDAGTVCMIFPCARSAELIGRLTEKGLRLTHQLLVRSRAGEEPFFSLLGARARVSPACAAAVSELVLYREGATAGLTEEAVRFCSWLACNQKRH